jgi:large subunit ribosomal protein L25
MADTHILAAEPRERAGKGTARAVRRGGKIPAVIYGNKEAPLSVAIEAKLIGKALDTPGFYTSLIDIEVNGTKHRVLPRDTQIHPVTGVPLHVDFLRFDPNRRVTVEVPVNFINEREAPGIVRGGLINVVRHAVEVNCSAANIPDQFEIDLTGLDIGDSIHAESVALPEGVEFTITDRDFTIATIAAPTVLQSEETATEGEETEDGAEPDGENSEE